MSCTVNRPSTLRRAASPTRWRRPGFVIRRNSAAAIPSTSRGSTSNPSRPSSRIAGASPTRVATIGSTDRHRFQRHHRHRLPQRRLEEDVERRQRAIRGVGQPAGQDDVVVEPELAPARLKLRAQPTFADHHEAHVVAGVFDASRHVAAGRAAPFCSMSVQIVPISSRPTAPIEARNPDRPSPTAAARRSRPPSSRRPTSRCTASAGAFCPCPTAHKARRHAARTGAPSTGHARRGADSCRNGRCAASSAAASAACSSGVDAARGGVRVDHVDVPRADERAAV